MNNETAFESAASPSIPGSSEKVTTFISKNQNVFAKEMDAKRRQEHQQRLERPNREGTIPYKWKCWWEIVFSGLAVQA